MHGLRHICNTRVVRLRRPVPPSIPRQVVARTCITHGPLSQACGASWQVNAVQRLRGEPGLNVIPVFSSADGKWAVVMRAKGTQCSLLCWQVRWSKVKGR